MDIDKKKELLSVSSSGKNAAAKGFMGKIGEIVENGILNFNDVMSLQQRYNAGYVDYAGMGFGVPGEYSSYTTSAAQEQMIWSLRNYRGALQEAYDEDESAREAQDELEKSIVANIAKDVMVGVKKDNVDLTIVVQ